MLLIAGFFNWLAFVSKQNFNKKKFIPQKMKPHLLGNVEKNSSWLVEEENLEMRV